MSPQRHAALGLFFVAVIGVLGYFTLFKTDFSLGGDTQQITVWFPEANGLRKGDAVWVAGVRWGKVEGLEYDSETDDIQRRIRVDLALDNSVDLYANHEIKVQESTVLGGKVLAIEPGTRDSGPRPEGELFGTVEANVLAALGDLVEENREPLTNTIANLDETMIDVRSLVAGAREGDGVLGSLFVDNELRDSISTSATNIEDVSADLKAITADARAGKGLVGRLLSDEELADRVAKVVEEIDSAVVEFKLLATDVREGKGTIGMLINDEEVAGRVRAALDDFAELTRGLRAGEGTLGMLLEDEELAAVVKGVIGDIKEVTTAIAEGKGTLGALIHEREVYDDVASITADLKMVVAGVANGEGTIGRLLQDDEIYDELARALQTLTGSLEEAREAAPVTAFISAVALGF